MDRELKDARKIFDHDDDQVGTGRKVVEELDVSVDGTVATGTGKGKGSTKGKGKRNAGRRGSDATEETVTKKRKVDG